MAEEFSFNAGWLDRHRAAIALIVLIAISALVRLIVGLNFRARASWDTGGYILTARAIANLDFSHYDGKRTPIYPLLLLFAGMDWDVVRVVQSLLGIAIGPMLFATSWIRTRNATAAFIVGLLGGLAPSELLFEQIIYSETLCTFWIVLSLFAYALTLANERTRIWDHALLGFSAALAGMTRPMFLFLGPLYFCLVFARVRPPRPPRLSDARLALVLAPTLLLALGWSAVNQYTVGYFGVTTTTGYNLSNHSGAFMELAPPAYRRISDIYVRQRLIQRWRMGNHTMTIWYAENEIKHSTGFSTAQLSMVLTQMSLEMFAEHPLLYLRSVSQSWARFWGSGLYRYLGSFKKHLTESFYDLLFAAASYQLAINLAFLSIAAYSIASWLLGRVKFDFELDVIAIVLAGSLLQAFMEYGENVRYLAPLVPLTIYTVVTFTWRASDLRGLLAA